MSIGILQVAQFQRARSVPVDRTHPVHAEGRLFIIRQFLRALLHAYGETGKMNEIVNEIIIQAQRVLPLRQQHNGNVIAIFRIGSQFPRCTIY